MGHGDINRYSGLYRFGRGGLQPGRRKGGAEAGQGLTWPQTGRLALAVLPSYSRVQLRFGRIARWSRQDLVLSDKFWGDRSVVGQTSHETPSPCGPDRRPLLAWHRRTRPRLVSP